MARTTYAGSASSLLARAQSAPDQWSESTLLLYERAAHACSFENDERRAGDTFMQLVRLHAELAFSDDATLLSHQGGGGPSASILLLDRDQRRQHLRLAIEFATHARRSFLFANSISQLDATAAIVELRYHLGERDKATPDEMFMAQQHSLAGNAADAADWYWRAARSGAKRAEDKPPDPFESFEEPNAASFRHFNSSITHLLRVGRYTQAASVALSMASTPKLIVQDQTRYYALASLCLIAAKLPEKVPQQHFMHGSKKFAATESGQRLLTLAKACETRNFTEVDSLLKKKRIHQLVPAVPSGADGGVNIMPQVMPILDCIRFEYGTYTAGKDKSGRTVTTAIDSAHYHDPFSDKGKGKQRAERAPSVSGVSIAGSGYLSAPDSATASLLAAHRATPLSMGAQSMYRVASPDPSMMAGRNNLVPPVPSMGSALHSLPTPPPPSSFPGSPGNVSRSATGSSGGPPVGYAPSSLSSVSGGYNPQAGYTTSMYPPAVPEDGVPPVPGYEQIYDHVPGDFAPGPQDDLAAGSLVGASQVPATLAPAPPPAAPSTLSSLDVAPLPVPPPRGVSTAAPTAPSAATPLPPTPGTPGVPSNLPVPPHPPVVHTGASTAAPARAPARAPAPAASAGTSSAGAAAAPAHVSPAMGLHDDPAPPPAYAPPSKGSRFSNFLRSKN